MKKYPYPLNAGYLDIFFPHHRIKSKVQILEILLEATRFILYSDSKDCGSDPSVILYIDKMSRLFFFNDKKYYSINFPFTFIIDEDSSVSASYKNLIEIDSQVISDILSILKDSRYYSESSMDFIEAVLEIEDSHNDRIWFLLRELLTLEDGYLRFDSDFESYKKAKDEGKEHMHPENHVDVFYTGGSTFKVGLDKVLSYVDFIDCVDSRTDCRYLTVFSTK